MIEPIKCNLWQFVESGVCKRGTGNSRGQRPARGSDVFEDESGGGRMAAGDLGEAASGVDPAPEVVPL